MIGELRLKAESKKQFTLERVWDLDTLIGETLEVSSRPFRSPSSIGFCDINTVRQRVVHD